MLTSHKHGSNSSTEDSTACFNTNFRQTSADSNDVRVAIYSDSLEMVRDFPFHSRNINWIRLFAQMITLKWWYLVALFVPYQLWILTEPRRKTIPTTTTKKRKKKHDTKAFVVLQIKITTKWLFNTLRGQRCNKRQHIWPVHVIYDYAKRTIVWVSTEPNVLNTALYLSARERMKGVKVWL